MYNQTSVCKPNFCVFNKTSVYKQTSVCTPKLLYVKQNFCVYNQTSVCKPNFCMYNQTRILLSINIFLDIGIIYEIKWKYTVEPENTQETIQNGEFALHAG